MENTWNWVCQMELVDWIWLSVPIQTHYLRHSLLHRDRDNSQNRNWVNSQELYSMSAVDICNLRVDAILDERWICVFYCVGRHNFRVPNSIDRWNIHEPFSPKSYIYTYIFKFFCFWFFDWKFTNNWKNISKNITATINKDRYTYDSGGERETLLLGVQMLLRVFFTIFWTHLHLLDMIDKCFLNWFMSNFLVFLFFFFMVFRYSGMNLFYVQCSTKRALFIGQCFSDIRTYFCRPDRVSNIRLEDYFL